MNLQILQDRQQISDKMVDSYIVYFSQQTWKSY